ncbi:AEC family transporter [Xanthobacter sp. TB0139]|uniref:AEC family transporter n=1 Tax=Xanthobacter sp. TB0139 TaxID=3459178 RepID=UPI00403A7431
MDISLVIHVVGPVFVLLGLGYFAGRTQQFNTEQMRGLSLLVLRYAMPAAIFLGMAHFDRDVLVQQGPLVLVMLFFYSGLFVLGYGLLLLLKQEPLRAALLSYTSTSKAATVYGLVVLVQLFGTDLGRAMVGLSALIMNLTQLSAAVYLFKSAAAKGGERPSLIAAIRRTALDPLVLAPALGAAVALSGYKLPFMVSDVLEPLAQSAGAIAIFSAGLGMATFRLRLRSPVIALGGLVNLVVIPALFFGLLIFFDISGPVAQAAFMVCMLPVATKALLFAEVYEEEEGEAASILLLTSLALLVTIPIGIELNRFLA